MQHNPDGPFMMPIVDKYSDRGTIVLGKVESGTCKKGQTLLLMPNRVSSLFQRNNPYSIENGLSI